MKWHCSFWQWLEGERTCTDELGRIVGKITRSWRGGYEIGAYAFAGSWPDEDRYISIGAAKRALERLLAKLAEMEKK